MLVIRDIKLNNVAISKEMFDIICSTISSELNKNKIQVNMKLDGFSITFAEIERKKIFLSKVDNKIVLNTDDKRISKLGRNFLKTRRITEAQFLFIKKVFTDLKQINVDFNMIIKRLDGDTVHETLVDMNYFKPLEKFPVAMEVGDAS